MYRLCQKTEHQSFHFSRRLCRGVASLNYDVEKVIEDIYGSGLYEAAPVWSQVTIHFLRTGEISHGEVLERAMQLCKEELGECKWPKIPDRYWKMAAKEMLPNE